MSGETIITITGNLTADPELRWIGDGTALTDFTIASTPRTFDRASNTWKDGEAIFMRCKAWRELGENCAESLKKGMRVVAQGRLQQRSWESPKTGEKHTTTELAVDDIGPSLRKATVAVTRTGQGTAPHQTHKTGPYTHEQAPAGTHGGWGQESPANPASRDPGAPPSHNPDDPWNPQPLYGDQPPF